jgi:hypothetical protein
MEIKELDWKIFRELREIALKRFCDQILSEVGQLIADTSKSSHQRYLALHQRLRRRDQELSAAFDGLRRSAAPGQLFSVHKLGLLTEIEIGRFSEEMRRTLDMFLAKEIN